MFVLLGRAVIDKIAGQNRQIRPRHEFVHGCYRLSDRERTATGREHNPHTTERSIDCQHRTAAFCYRGRRQTSFLVLSVADRIVGNRAREQYSDCNLLSERRSRWPGRPACWRPVPSNRARQKARQPASPCPRTRRSNPVPSSGESRANLASSRSERVAIRFRLGARQQALALWAPPKVRVVA